ncbi:MAG TPA: TrkH family potassium uptake protein [Candidatus Bathyarchaeota archaeon]|nr:TrkH family potassium uptake protein [Candidatus Bathyarchaeota archaeon]
MQFNLDPIMLTIIGILIGFFIFLLFLFYTRRHVTKQYLYYSKLEPVLANLGFLLQISGFFYLPSIIYAYYLGELNAAVGFCIGALIFLFLGFLLTFLFETKTLNVKQSCMLLVLYFMIVPLIYCVPYLYLGIFSGSVLDQLLNSWFETSSAVSTTGLTLLKDVTIPKSVILARGISEWAGGIGIIFILLSFLYPSEALSHYGKALGIEKIAGDYKVSFLVVLLIYLLYTLAFSAILILLGLDGFTAFHTVLTILSTTGLTVVNVLEFPLSVIVVITVMMIFSAFSFSFHLELFSFLLRKKTKITLSKEIKLYLISLLIFTLAFGLVTKLNPLRAFFHVVDFSASVGLNVVPFEEIGELGKIILVIIMLVGPCSFSVGGGIRIFRIYIIGKILLSIPQIFLTGKIPEVKIGGKRLEKSDALIHLLTAFLFILISFFAAIILCGYGYSFVDALVESASAITTTGDSPKILTPSLPFIPKFLLIILMLVGRIEILPAIVAFSNIKAPE